MDKMKLSRNLTLRYAFLQGMFWISYSIITGFAAVFLGSLHYNTAQIGIILSIASVLTIIIQPMIASFADKATKISLKNITSIVMVFILVFSILLYGVPYSFLFSAIFYILICMLQFSLPTLLNSLALEYMNIGIPINYGLARGIGSISFAVVSFILGIEIQKKGADILIPLYILCYILIIALTYSFQVSAKSLENIDGIDKKYFGKKGKVNTSSIMSILTGNKRFTVLLVGIVLVFICHNMLNTYLIQILNRVGGDNVNLGISIGLAAALELPTMAFFVYMVRKVKCGILLKISAVFFVIKALLMLVANNVYMVYLSQSMQILAFALFTPASVYYVNQIMSESDKVKGQSLIFVATMGISGMLGNLIAGQILNYAGVPTMLFTGVLFSIVGCILMLVSTENIA